MSPVSDNFLNAMENSDTEEVTFGGQGIYERSDLPDAIIVQSDEVRTLISLFQTSNFSI